MPGWLKRGAARAFPLPLPNFAVTYQETQWQYLEYVLNYPVKRYTGEMGALDGVQAMPAFPEKDSVAMVDGVAVVKLSE